MEVAEAVRFGDGRLLILAVGIARFRVLRPTQDVPYSRADVELLLDAEEQQSFEQLAVQALDSVRGGLEGEVPMSTLMAAVPDAAQAAAAAYGAAWVEYELSDMRAECGEEPRVIDGSRTEQAQLMGRRLAAIAGNEVMQLPFWDALASTAQAAGQPTAGPGALADQGPAAAAGTVRLLEEAAAHLRPRLRRMEAEAQVLATRAAVSRVAHHLDLRQPQEGEEEAAVPPPPPPSRPVLNTTSERGIAWQAPDEVLDASGGPAVLRCGCSNAASWGWHKICGCMHVPAWRGVEFHAVEGAAVCDGIGFALAALLSACAVWQLTAVKCHLCSLVATLLLPLLPLPACRVLE
jgi:hypothetical protein